MIKCERRIHVTWCRANQKGVSRFQILFAAKIFEILLLLLNFTEYHVTLKSVTIVTGRHANHIIYQKNCKNLRFWKNIDKIEVGIFLQTSFFEVKLFQKLLQNFLWGLRTCSQYLKSPHPNLGLWFDEKIVTARHTNLITCQEITRTVEILKHEAKIKIGIFWKTWFFVVKHFQKNLPNFLWTLRTCSRYLESPPNLDLCVNEKIVTVRHNNMILCQEKSKKLKFWKMKSKVRFEYSDKPQFLRWNFFSKISIKFSVGFTNIFKGFGRSTQPRSLRQ